MAAIGNTPSNINFLSPLKFTFKVEKLPHVNFFVQSVTIPSVSITPVNLPSPFIKLPTPGDHIEFTELLLTFRVDEDMKNYMEIFNWLMALGFPKDFSQYKALADKDRRTNVLGTDGIMTDGSLIVQNSNVQSHKMYKFINMFPTTLSEITFDTRQSDVDYLECTVSFTYERFEIEDVN